MSEADDALRESAANRGLKLLRSRLRTPGKGDYGRFGLKDAKTGKAVLGIDGDSLTATREDIEAFLRGGAAASWKSSLGAVPKPKKAARARAAPAPSPPPPPPPAPAPVRVRVARPKDAEAIATLITALGYELTAADVRKRLAALRKEGGEALVVERGALLGIVTIANLTVLHRPLAVGRLTLLVIDESARGQGLGKALVAEAEARLKARGCGTIEVTSNRKRARAHEFYESLGYERTSYRFAKAL